MTTFKDVFPVLEDRSADAAPAVRDAFAAILRGEWTPVQVAGLAVALRMRGDDARIIAAAATALREAMVPVEHGLPEVMDTCGTGGDGLATWNLSTAAAFVVAGAGVPVAKHGNRAVSSRSGSADVLDALGVHVEVDPAKQADVLRRAGICFLYAPTHHPAMKHGGTARRELGIRTVFNALGPLANPARVSHQLLGAYDDKLRPVLAETLRKLGTVRAWVVRGEDGLDEVSPCGPTRVTELSKGEISERVVVPEDFGIARLRPEVLAGAEAMDNAAMLLGVLAGEAHPARDAVLLNAAAALVVALELPPLEAAARARASLEEGKALRALDLLVQSSREGL